MPTPYKILIHEPAEIESEYPRLWATINSNFPDLSDYQKSVIASLVLDTCHSCHDESAGCQCWNDK
jgi:hypothetical protein